MGPCSYIIIQNGSQAAFCSHEQVKRFIVNIKSCCKASVLYQFSKHRVFIVLKQNLYPVRPCQGLVLGLHQEYLMDWNEFRVGLSKFNFHKLNLIIEIP